MRGSVVWLLPFLACLYVGATKLQLDVSEESLRYLDGEVHYLKQHLYEQISRNNALESSLKKLSVEMADLKQSMNTVEKAVSYSARTCHELMSGDPSLESGMYYVDPDGWNSGDAPIYVDCSKTGQTTIHHDSEAKTGVGHCYDPGCYSRSVNYTASMRQIRAVMDLSQNCEQFIRYDCLNAVFAFENLQYSWWNDRSGQPHYYWDGSNDTVHTCACGIQGNCIEARTFCNCDSGAPTPLYDEGKIRNKDHLPISRLNFGRTSLTYSFGEHTLGPLICSGTNQLEPNTKPSSCSDLWRSGNTISGFYLVQPKEGTVNTVYCDFTKLPTETGHETFIGVTDVKSTVVHFHVARSTSYANPGSGPLPFDVTILNIGNAMNIQSGRFTAPLKGVYTFNFVYSVNTTDTWIPMLHNDRVIASSHVASDVIDSASVAATLSLEKNDIVWLRLSRGALYSDVNYHVHFTGHLIQEL